MHCATSVRDGVFLLCRHLCEGACIALGNKHRVVPEALRTGQMVYNSPLNLTLKEVLLASENQRNHGAKTCRAIALAFKVFQEQGIVRCKVVSLACIASRANTRCAPQGINLQTCIVGKTVGTRTLIDVTSLL